MFPRTYKSPRRGGTYIVVLGTSMIVAVLGMTALVAQRIQNRMLTASTDVRQAQLNAHAAVDLALLTMKQDTSWRTNQSNGSWFTGRGTGAGTCSVNVTDPTDSNLADDANEPISIRGIGYSGKAEQRFDIAVDPRHDPLSCLRYGVAASDIVLQSDTLRSTGTISANTFSASSAQTYGNVEAVSISGSTYNGTNTTIAASKLPTMPDWSTVFSYYRTNGVQLNINNIPSWSSINLGRNTGIESSVSTNDWFAAPAGSTADIDTSSQQHLGSRSLRVRNRSDQYAGPAQPIDGYVKSGQDYYVEAYVYHSSTLPVFSKAFRISLYTKGIGNASALISTTADIPVYGSVWTKVSATIPATAWSGNLEYAYVKFRCTDENVDFLLDDFVIRETTTGRVIYQKVLSPSVNQLYLAAPTDPSGKGIYWINCAGSKLIIERSRILGTLLLVNPGVGSCVANGPIYMSPAVPGYPALMVDADNPSDADFAINATNRALSEKENGVNFNPSGAAHEDLGYDTDQTDIYQSVINGLVVIRDDLTFQNTPLIRGQLIVGDDISTSSGTLEIQYQAESLLNPPPGFFAPYTYVRRPISGRKSVLP